MPSETEIYLVARGTSAVRVEREMINLSFGEVLMVEPGGTQIAGW
ncbi:MAG: hypothetical protein P8Z00_05795 [Anaerolineales bacterium]|jgi:hypothetical protein